jgi:Dolichyl-phosphate-mannose-protein mannosyltransferase
MKNLRSWTTLAAIIALAAIMFFTGINWGLPSLDADAFLFAGRTPWTGQQIIDRAGGWDQSADRGADIAMHPLSGRDKPIVLNDTDAQRAAIVRRYRLYSNQPDEMITFRSLSGIKPAQHEFDPHFYQYGGLWVYPVGALLKIAGEFGLITLRNDLAFYLDHPDEFAKMYIIARAYSAAWGIIGVIVIFALGLEWTGKTVVGALAAALFAVMPLVVNMAHEAKPHLPGTVLTLLAVYAAMRFAKSGEKKWWWMASIACGAAFGMVLTGIVSFAVLPVMMCYRPMSWSNRSTLANAAGIVGLVVFAIFNPYLLYNLLFHRSLVQSNVGNYGNFYQPEISVEAVTNAARLLGLGMTLPLLAAAAVSVLFLLIRRKSKYGSLLAVPAILVAIQYVLLARGKPAEYGRFALTLDVMLALAVAAAVGSIGKSSGSRIAAAMLVICTGLGGVRYVANFVQDSTIDSSRRVAGEELSQLTRKARVIAVTAEPAPYCLPPVDLFDCKIVLLPRGTQAGQFDLGPHVISVKAVDGPVEPWWRASPISWANKPFAIAASSFQPPVKP